MVSWTRPTSIRARSTSLTPSGVVRAAASASSLNCATSTIPARRTPCATRRSRTGWWATTSRPGTSSPSTLNSSDRNEPYASKGGQGMTEAHNHRHTRLQRLFRPLALALIALAACLAALPASAQQPDKLDRTVLPIPEPKSAPITELDARKAKAPPRFEVKAPKGAPNVVIVLIDDMGFGQPSTFGGGVAMPTLDRLAGSGRRDNHVHTPALG